MVFECSVPLVEVNIGLLADQVGVTTTDTLDLGQGVHDLLLAIDVGVQKTQDLEGILLVSWFCAGCGSKSCRAEPGGGDGVLRGAARRGCSCMSVKGDDLRTGSSSSLPKRAT